MKKLRKNSFVAIWEDDFDYGIIKTWRAWILRRMSLYLYWALPLINPGAFLSLGTFPLNLCSENWILSTLLGEPSYNGRSSQRPSRRSTRRLSRRSSLRPSRRASQRPSLKLVLGENLNCLSYPLLPLSRLDDRNPSNKRTWLKEETIAVSSAQSTFEPLWDLDSFALPIPPVPRVLPSQEAPALKVMGE